MKGKWNDIYASSRTPWLKSETPAQQLNSLLQPLRPSPLIVDFGCGDGRLSVPLARRGASVIAIDCSYRAIQLAKAEPNVAYAVGTSFAILRKNTADAVLMWGVLHHYNPESWPIWLKDALSAVRAGGTILIGIFDASDVKFSNRPSRRSSSTNDSVYASDQNRTSSIISSISSLLDTGVVNLADSDRTIRTWIYYLCRKNQM